MSKHRALLIFLPALVLAFAACGGGGEQAPPGGETPGAATQAGTVTIDLWHSESAANLDVLQALISRYNSSQDEVKVQAFFQGNTDEQLMAKLVTSLASDKVPAVAVLSELDTQMMLDSGAVVPVQDFIDREDYDLSGLDRKSVKEYTVRDKLWAMPLGSGVPLLYYNKVTFREVGLDPEQPPRDLEELRQYSEQLLKRDASGNVVRSGIALDNQEWTQRTLAENGDPLVDNNNGRDGRATRVLLDNDTGRWFFQWWHDMVDEGLAFNVGRNLTYADGFLAIVSGRAAMTLSYSNALGSVMDALEKGVQGVEIGVAAVPGMPGGTGAPLLFGRVLWVLNLRPEREQEAAWKFIKWLEEPEQQAEWFAGTGYLPANRSAINLPAARDTLARYPQFQVPLDIYLNSPISPASLNALIGPFWQVQEAFHQGAEAMLSGAKDPVSALEDAAADANRIIEEYNQRVED